MTEKQLGRSTLLMVFGCMLLLGCDKAATQRANLRQAEGVVRQRQQRYEELEIEAAVQEKLCKQMSLDTNARVAQNLLQDLHRLRHEVKRAKRRLDWAKGRRDSMKEKPNDQP